MTKKSILMVMMGFALLGAPMSTNAQVGKTVAKVIKKIKPPKPPKKSTTVKPVLTNCISCSGKGYKNGVKCSNCNGSGKKVHYVKK